MSDHVTLGKLCGVHGVKGWLKVFSDTRPATNIFDFHRWQLRFATGEYREVTVQSHQSKGAKLLVKLTDVDDRDQAVILVGCDVEVSSHELPELHDEFYWRELIGLTVINTQGECLGTVVDLLETGANDVLLLKASDGKIEALPWLPEVVLNVDINASKMMVEWETLI